MLINNIERDRKQLYESGVEQGIVTGVAQGIEKGRHESNLEFARMMLASGEPLAKIKMYTSLTEDEILSLQKESVSN